MIIRNDRMTHESSLCWSLCTCWGFADSEIDGEDKDFFALEVRVTAARSCYSRSRRCIVGTAGDWKRPAEPVCFLTMMHGVSHGSLNRSAAGEKGYESDRNEKRKNQSRLEESNWRLSFVWNFSQQFCQVHWKCTFPKVTSCFGWRRTWTGCNRNFSSKKCFKKWRDLMDKRYEAKCRYR